MAKEYKHGDECNDPMEELVVALEIIRPYIPNEMKHPACVRELQLLKKLIREIAKSDG